jgi:hypothetical protein
VQVGQHVDQALADAAALRRLVGVAGRELADGVQPDDPLHHVERRPEHRLVGAQVDRARHRDGRGAQRRDDPVLARHVVGGGQHGAGRRPAEDHRLVVVPVVRTALGRDDVGEVRHSRGDQFDADRPPLLVVEDARQVRPDDGWIGTHGSRHGGRVTSGAPPPGRTDGAVM